MSLAEYLIFEMILNNIYIILLHTKTKFLPILCKSILI